MNPDYTSDIRLVERFIFQHNLYLLTMFQKKVDSFNTSYISVNKDSRRQHRQANLHSATIIDCDNFLHDPIKNSVRDLTKPIWNCTTKVDPKIIYPTPHSFEHFGIVNLILKLLDSFFNRLKNQHQDQSSLRIIVHCFQNNQYFQNRQQQIKQNPQTYYITLKANTNQLFSLLLSSINRQISQLLETTQQNYLPQQIQYIKSILSAGKQILQLYLLRQNQNLYNQVNAFNSIVVTNLTDVTNCKTGSLILCMTPQLLYLPLLIHPLLIPIYSLLKTQLKIIQKREQIRASKNITNNLTNITLQPNIKQMQTQHNIKDINWIFDDIIKNQNISRVVFLNLDGYQSQFNIDVAKYLYKCLMYISFPRQPTKLQKKDDDSMTKSQYYKSHRLLRKYFYGGLTSQQKNKLLSYYKPSQNDLKSNLYIFPLHSKALTQIYGLPQLYNFQTAFISFIMSQIMYSQILSFNPSIIIISYSQKINIVNQHFIQLIKQLTILANYKIIFYPNLSKNYLFMQQYPQEFSGKQFLNSEKQHFNTHQSQIKIFHQAQSTQFLTLPNLKISSDIFQKLSIVTKISSGTYNLNKTPPIDCFIQKYKNYKIMNYTSLLIKIFKCQFSNIYKLSMRLNDYYTISQVFNNYFNHGKNNDYFDKLFAKSINKFYINLFKQLQKLLKIQKSKPNHNQPSLHNTNQQQIQQLLSQILIKTSNISQTWKNFKFQKFISISTQKLQPRFFAHLPKYKSGNKRNIYKKQAENLICLEFYILIDKQKVIVQLSPSSSKVYYSPTRKHPNSLIYVTNHLAKITTTQYSHYCGIVTQQFDYKVSPKVQLQPITFIGGPILSPFQTFTEFNYFQTQTYIFMYWPKFFDFRKQYLNEYNSTKYIPQSLPLFYRSFRKFPCIFELIHNSSTLTPSIIPRHGCQCYQVQDTNTIYIFGGFYGDQKNYLLFQTDITRLFYKSSQNNNQNPIIYLQNIPKTFYFDYQTPQTNLNLKTITKLKNDIIRPKIQYQFFQLQQHNSTNNQKIVFIIGGIGQNFIRPYSMIGYMAHKLIFNLQTGAIQHIKRVKMHNIIPVNTHNLTKLRSPLQSKILSHAQNRSINFVVGQSGPNAYSIYHNRLTYHPQDQKFDYETQYQFLDLQARSYRQQVSYLRRVIADNAYRIGIQAKSSRGKQFNTNFITVTLDKQGKYILQLQLQLSLDAKYIHPDLPNYVRLTGSSIISIDINATIIYALIKHPIYTLDQSLLACYDLNDLTTRLKQQRPVQIHMKQLHKFDQDVSVNILIAANANTVVIVHGQKFDSEVQVNQILLRRTRRNHMKMDKIYSNDFKDLNVMESIHNKNKIYQDFYQYAKINVVGGISCSVFINQNNGTILCFSFKTIDRNDDIQIVVVVLEKLQLNGDKFIWQKMLTKKYEFIIASQLNIQKAKRREPFKLFQIIQHRKQTSNPLKCQYQIIAFYKDKCIQALMQLQSLNNKIKFNYNGKSVSEYFKQLSKNTAKQHSILLQKYNQMYSQLKDNKNNQKNPQQIFMEMN